MKDHLHCKYAPYFKDAFDIPRQLGDLLAMRVLILCLALAGCTPDLATIQMSPRPVPQTPEEIAFVAQLFNDIQPASFADAREYCGMIGVTADGTFVATEPRRGRQASCLPPSPLWAGIDVIASYHTHGAADQEYFTEIPSYEDMRTDIEDDTDGYIATPGGRFWYVDARARTARLICGPGCLRTDPAHVEDDLMIVQPTYSLQELSAF